MKSGLAAGLAAMEAFAAEAEREGNLLFVAVPDEEANSAGARSAAQALPEIAARLGLSLEAAINLDALVDEGEGEIGRSVALGTVGKLLPSALVVGQPVHASNSASGLNAGALAAAIATEMEWAPALTDSIGDERAPPPTLLGLKDSRTAYDVTTPERVWAYWNVMLLSRGAPDVLATFAGICRKAAADALAGLTSRLEALGGTGRLPSQVPVLTFAELRAQVLDADPAEAERFARLARDLAARGVDLPEQCRMLTEHLWSASRRPGPAIVVGFASLPYLPTILSGEAGERLESAAHQAAESVAARRATTISIRRTFPGISDMSYFGQADAAAIPVIAANTPAWGFGIDWPAEFGPLGVPIVNAGPWGRDYHTRLERLYAPYAFEILPELLLVMAKDVLSRP